MSIPGGSNDGMMTIESSVSIFIYSDFARSGLDASLVGKAISLKNHNTGAPGSDI